MNGLECLTTDFFSKRVAANTEKSRALKTTVIQCPGLMKAETILQLI